MLDRVPRHLRQSGAPTLGLGCDAPFSTIRRSRLPRTMHAVFVALRDLWRSKLRFGLLAGAIALLVFLLLFLNTLSATLLGFFVGAIENNSAEVLVYEDTARRNLQASRLDQSVVDEVAAGTGCCRRGSHW